MEFDGQQKSSSSGRNKVDQCTGTEVNWRAVDDGESEYQCGYGSCTPKVLQRFHTSRFLLATLCLCAVTQGIAINGLIPVSITTLEKRFHLSSTESGLFAGMYDIAVVLVLVPLSYFGGKGHKGRYLGWGIVIMGIGSFICALPQFTTGAYDYGQATLRDTCLAGANASAENCQLDSNNNNVSQLRLYLYVLLLAQLFHGIGASPLYTLGITYIDENTSQRSSPLYLGIYIGFSTVGPALGFILGGMLLRVYGDIGKVDLDSVHLSSSDPRWYGAWWIGFVITAGLAFLFSIPMLSFARELPEAKQHRLKDIDQTHRRSSIGFSPEAFSGGLGSIWASFKQLFKNPTFTCLMVMQCAETFLLNGFVVFMPKLVENMFSMSSSNASMITGAVLIPFGFAGNIFGGYLLRRLKLLCNGAILLALAFHAAAALFVLAMLIDCPKKDFVGITHPYVHGKDFTSSSLTDTCNSACQCDTYYQPVCNPFEDVTYFSPCFAGCSTKVVDKDGKQTWSNCSCVSQRINFTGQWNQDNFISNQSSSFPDSVQQGLCSSSCNLTVLFFILFSIEVFFIFSSAMPIQQAELRCVPFQLRTMAVGLRWIFGRLIGAVPGTIGFGAAIDTTCQYWGARCGERASCLRYDSRRMALVIMGFALTLKAVAIISLFLAWKFYIPPVETTKETQVPVGQKPIQSRDHYSGNKVSPTSGTNNVTSQF